MIDSQKLEKSDSDKKTYRQILRSTSIMGGASVISILLRIIRTKVLAVLLGPSGVGLISIYESITSLASSIAGMGVGTSGIRQIAEAFGTGNQEKISRTIICLRRIALFSGVAGLCLLFLLRGAISQITFGNSSHVHDIALLSVTILFAAVSGGQVALVQGMRRIKYLAMLSILGALLGTLLSIPIIYIFGEKGIVLFLIAVSSTSILTSWWYSRKIKTIRVTLSWRDVFIEAKPLLRLGLVFMSTALMSAGALYVLRVFVIRSLGLDAAGIYQAAITLSAIYVGFILEAMGKDFYPRLTAVAQYNDKCTSLINHQMEIGLLIAIPGIVATMTFAPIVINIFYSAKFLLAVDVLRWQILGILLRIIIWPMGFIFIAKGNGKLFFWTELFANCTHLALLWLGVKYFGLPGTGMAFFGMYLLYGFLIYSLVRTYYSFKLSPKNIRIIAITVLATGIVFLSPYLLSKKFYFVINAGITITVAWYSIKTLIEIVGEELIPGFLLKIKLRFGI